MFLDRILYHRSSLAETFSLEEQETEENFDLALISSLEIDLVPHLGGPRVPDYLVGQLAKILHQGSQLYKFHASRSGSPREEFEKLDLESVGSTATGEVVPRERFSYWCFDLLFLICSNMTSGGCWFYLLSYSLDHPWKQTKRRRGGESLRCVCRRCWIDARRLWWVISRTRRFAVVYRSQGDSRGFLNQGH